MQLKEIIKIEEENKADIHLHKDGIFWRAYNVSAFQFSKYLREFKVNKRLVKSIQGEMAYLGFPEKTMTTVIQLSEQNNYEIRQSDTHIQILGLPAIMGSDYSEWFTALPLNTNPINREESSNKQDIINQIRSYPLLEKSPLEAQGFILNLQKLINGTA